MTTAREKGRAAKKGRPSNPVSTDTFPGRLGAAIRERRQALGMTLDDAAAASGGLLSASMIGSYEGGTEPGIRRYLLLCLTLGVCPVDLLPPGVVDMFGKRIDPAKAGKELGGKRP